MTYRNLSVDVLRGMGILAVVSGHASSGTALYPFAPYSFHMPLFFFLSGIFFSETKIEGILAGFYRNIKTLLLPVVIFYAVYSVLCQALGALGFFHFPESISINKIIFDQFQGAGAYKFTAAYWFLPCLFFVRTFFSVVHSRVFYLLDHFFLVRDELKVAFFLSIYLMVGIFATRFSVLMYEDERVSWSHIPWLRFAFALFFFYLGSVFQKYNFQRFLTHAFVLVALYIAQQQLWAYSGNLDFWMQVSKYGGTYLPFISSIISIGLFFGLANIFSKNESLGLILGYIGRNSLPILLHHLFGFFLVNLILCLTGIIKPSEVLGPYYQWQTVNSWPIYIFFGVAFSLVVDRYLVARSVVGIKGGLEKIAQAFSGRAARL